MPDLHIRPLVAALLAALLGAVLLPVASLADSPSPTYDLYVRDAPFTRNQTVRLEFRGPLINPPPVTAYYASNDDLLDGEGHLLNRVAMSFAGPWTLAAGEDGPRTVYGQVLFGSGDWSPVLHLDLVLATDAASALAMDLDPQSTSTVIHLSGGHQWQEVLRTPDELFEAGAPTTSQFTIWSSFWIVGFSTASGPFAPGHYDIGPFDENGNCVGNCADVWTETQTQCLGTHSGWFDINEIEFAPEGDLRMADVDFHIVCRGWMVEAGTALYGTERGLVALSQSAHQLSFGAVEVGSSADAMSVAFRNIGDLPLEFGQATIGEDIANSFPGDYTITTDNCSNVVVQIDATCEVGVRFTPQAMGTRWATIEIADNTDRGSRHIPLRGSGQQQTTLTMATTGSLVAPGPVTISATLTPGADSNCPLQFVIEGLPEFYPDRIQWTYTWLTDPSRYVQTATLDMPPGDYTASASFHNCGPLLASSDSIDFTVTGDDTPPSGTMIINGGSGVTNAGDVHLDLSASDPSGITKVAVAATQQVGTETWIYFDPTSSVFLPLYPGDATYTVMARWRDGAANWSEPVSQTITLDTVAPDVTPPDLRFESGQSIVNGRVEVYVPLSGSDATTAVADYDLSQRTDTGAWTNVDVSLQAVQPALPSSVDRSLLPGHAYTFRARATDMATNVSGWAQGPKLTLRKYQELNSAIHYAGTWRRVSGTFWGGYAKKSMTAGASAALTFSGRAAAWVSLTGPDRGRAQVLVNGIVVATVDLYSPVVSTRTVVWAGNWTTTASRTITVRNLATPGRPRIDLDAFLIAH